MRLRSSWMLKRLCPGLRPFAAETLPRSVSQTPLTPRRRLRGFLETPHRDIDLRRMVQIAEKSPTRPLPAAKRAAPARPSAVKIAAEAHSRRSAAARSAGGIRAER